MEVEEKEEKDAEDEHNQIINQLDSDEEASRKISYIVRLTLSALILLRY